MSGVGTTVRPRPLLGSSDLHRAARVGFGVAGARASVARTWSPRRTLAFVMLTCGGFWSAVLVLTLR